VSAQLLSFCLEYELINGRPGSRVFVLEKRGYCCDMLTRPYGERKGFDVSDNRV
jgi:hypothetical protein